MIIESFKNFNYKKLFEPDLTKREIGFSSYKNAVLTGRNSFYPNVLILSENKIFNPYDEKVMSLNKESFYDNNEYELNETSNLLVESQHLVENPVFFFIYNFDNYYHFLYDTLPYLVTFYHLKKIYPTLKLLVNYPNKDKKEFYRFNQEFLEKLVDINDLIIHDTIHTYKELFISSSYTHGGFSNEPPRPEIFTIYDLLKKNVCLENVSEKYKNSNDKNMDKIYISRRTWINNDTSNIGTNYTLRRKMINEDELVGSLVKQGFTEIFTENLNTDEKIYLFSNAKIICGSIGGGTSNLLFSNKNTKSFVLVTPYFLDINYRFRYSMENTNITYFYKCSTIVEIDKYPLYVRVQIKNDNLMENNKIGEIVGIQENKYVIQLSNNDIAGFNQSIIFETKLFEQNDFVLLDKGLNSPYSIDINEFINILNN